MSTHSNIPESRRQGIGLTALSILSGLLLALQFVLPPAAFASSGGRLATPAFSQQGVLDLAGVSVVRLVISYTLPPNHTTIKQCTTLGTLVGSWKPTSPTDQNNWVLTDGSLVNLNKACQTTAGQLAEIQILANTAYSGTHSNVDLLDTIACRVQTQPTPCADNAVPEIVPLASNGGALFSFHTDALHLQPFLQVVGQSEAQAGIELATSSASSAAWPSKTALTASDTPQMYLTPKLVDNTPGSTTTGTSTPGSGSSNLTASNEPGMPFFNSEGALVGMNLAGNSLLSGQAIQNLLKQQPELQAPPTVQHANPLNDGWHQGIQQYETGQYAQAQATLHQIDALNPQFQAASTFEQMAAAKIHGGNGTVTGSNPSSKQGSEALNLSTILVIIGLVAGVPLLILLLVVVGLRTRRRRELARFEAERAEAQRIAERQVQQQNLSVEKSKQALPLQHFTPGEPRASTVNPQSPPDIFCLNCGHRVHADATYCPNCRYPLSPTAPGTRPTIVTSSIPEPPLSVKAPASSIITQPQQAPVKEAVLDEQAIRATLQRLWDRAGR